MVIALIAEDRKKELLNQFCIAYCNILSKQKLCATGKTGRMLHEATGLKIESLLPGSHGGVQQITSRVAFDEIDVVIFFRDSSQESSHSEVSIELLRLCDIHNIPVATNIASAEVIIRGVERGDIDWRELVNPNSDYNIRRREIEKQRHIQKEKEREKRRRDIARQNRLKRRAEAEAAALAKKQAEEATAKKQNPNEKNTAD